MDSKFIYYFSRIKEQLWIRPVLFCLFSLAIVYLAHFADDNIPKRFLLEVNIDSLKELLTTMSSSMLVIAIFAMGSMVTAYSAASNTATPRSFSLIVADDVSQNALSVFIGSFIYSVVATLALQNNYYQEGGQLTLLIATLLMFALVIITFLRWVERIARLGRLNSTVDNIEKATAKAIINYRENPLQGCKPLTESFVNGLAIESNDIGYVQLVNTEELQDIAEALDTIIHIDCNHGSFMVPGKLMVTLEKEPKQGWDDEMKARLQKAITVGQSRVFEGDPRFGLIALSEVASRALSPGINDPGTAITILGSHVRMFAQWHSTQQENKNQEPPYDRVFMPYLDPADLFEDAFRPIARDGAGNIEVMIRLQKALRAIGSMGNESFSEAVKKHRKDAFARAKITMKYEGDIDLLREYVDE
jgi:uncharacterized membrane protein